MTDDIKALVERLTTIDSWKDPEQADREMDSAADALLRQAARIAALTEKCSLFEAALDQSDRRIAELEEPSAEPVVWFGENNYCTTNREIAERFNLRPAYAAPVTDSAMAKDAERYDFLRQRAELRQYDMGYYWHIKTVDVPMGMPAMAATLANVIDWHIDNTKKEAK